MYIDQHEAETMAFTTVACCILHNVCIMQDDVVDILQADVDEDNDRPPNDAVEDIAAIDGAVKRLRIMNRLAA